MKIPAAAISLALLMALVPYESIAASSKDAEGIELILSVQPSGTDLRLQRDGVLHAARIMEEAIPQIRDARLVEVRGFGQTLQIERKAFSARDGGWTWEGSIGTNDGWGQFVLQDGRLAGYLQASLFGPTIEIVPLADGSSAFMQRDPGAEPAGAQPLVPDSYQRGSKESDPLSVNEAADATQPVPATFTWIDALVAYTPGAEARMGGTAGVKARAFANVAWMNRALHNSKLPMGVRLVAVKRLDIDDPRGDSWNAYLSDFRRNPTVESWRDSYGADLVALYAHQVSAPVCGLGYVMRSASSDFAEWAYQVTWIDCSARTYAHEHGHNLGLEHDPGNSSTSPENASYPWSFGHGIADGSNSFRSIMAYVSVCGGNPCTQLWGYSNPGVSLNGHLTGIPNERDSAHTLYATRDIAADFRPSQILFQSGFD